MSELSLSKSCVPIGVTMNIYHLIAIIKGIRRRFLVDKAEYKTYTNSDNVGGWHGWYEYDGKCVAFRDTEGKISFVW